MPGRICTYRMHWLEGPNDPLCTHCWENYTESVEYPNGDFDCKLSEWYADRDECFEENVLTEKEFAYLQQRRPREIVVGRMRMTFMVDGEMTVTEWSIVNKTKKVLATKLEDDADHRRIYINTTTLEEIKED